METGRTKIKEFKSFYVFISYFICLSIAWYHLFLYFYSMFCFGWSFVVLLIIMSLADGQLYNFLFIAFLL